MATKKQQWLRDASMHRLNMNIQNKKEYFHNASLLIISSNAAGNSSNLEESGLSDFESSHIGRWVNGSISGRHCLLAIMDNRSKHSDSVESKPANSNRNSCLKPISLLSTTVNLPANFLSSCNSGDHGFGELYESIFKRPVTSVIREALQLLLTKAMESKTSSLTIDQVNIALKQIRVDNLIKPSKGGKHSQENCENKPPSSGTSTASQRGSHEGLRMQIFIELIRLHVNSMGVNNAQEDSSTSVPQSSVRASSVSRNLVDMVREGLNSIDLGDAADTVSPARGHARNSDEFLQELLDIETHLGSSCQKLKEDVQSFPTAQIEATNALLRPYIKQLAALKACLSLQLVELENSKAFITLGVSKDSSDVKVKKAYHAMAIKLHPDKPGGDTVKFQELQDAYHEIISKRRSSNSSGSVDSDDNAASKSMTPEQQEARSILQKLMAVLVDIKGVADHCTQIAQLNIHWVKRIEKVAQDNAYPDAILEIDLLTNTKYYTRPCARAGQAVAVGLDDISPTLVMPALEVLCECMQKLAATAMELPGCGVSYSTATAVHSSYMKAIEKCMTAGLAALKSLPTLANVDNQISSCMQKIHETLPHAVANNTVHGILIEMVLACFRNVSVNISSTAEKVVACALVAAEVYNDAEAIVHSADAHSKASATRTSEQAAAEEDYCQEDIDQLNQLRKQRHTKSTAASAEDDETKTKDKPDDSEEDTKKKKTKESGDGDEHAEDDASSSYTADDDANDEYGLNTLRRKIREVQSKLCLENVSALQTLNSETRRLQLQLQKQLVALAVSTCNLDSIVIDLTKTSFSASDSAASTASLSSSSSSSAFPPSPPPQATAKQKAPATYRTSLFSALADFVDSSCNSFRGQVSEALLQAKAVEGAQTGAGTRCTETLVREVMMSHVGWMLALCGSTACDHFKNIPASTAPPPLPCSSSSPSSSPRESDIADTAAETGNVNSSNNINRSSSNDEEHQPALTESVGVSVSVGKLSVKLALMSDVRSKTLWLASLLDHQTACVIVESELRTRLNEAISFSCSQETTSIDNDDEDDSITLGQKLADQFCNLVVSSIVVASSVL